MDNNPFKVFGSSNIPCLGRDGERTRVARLLANNHISIVGPRYIGKTVFARELCGLFSNGGDEISGSIYWDLGQRTPLADDDFYAQFAAVLGRGLKTISPESSEKLIAAKENFHEEIHDVFDYLQEMGICVLVCLDSFDYLLGRGVMTRNLWDNLGALADDFKSIRYLAISRRTLNELCWVPGSENSHFWKLFGTSPQLLKCMSDTDVEQFAAAFAENGVAIGTGFTRELWNWSGGIPPLIAALARDIWNVADGSTTFDNELVNRAGTALLTSTDTLLGEFWRSLKGEEQRLIVELGEHGKQIDVTPAVRSLVDAQVITQQGKSWHVQSRLLRRYGASEHGKAGGYLREFFESPNAYARNIRSVLEFRLAQLGGIDKTLRTHVTDMVEKLDEPDIVISKPRLISNRAFELIWAREFGGYTIPGEWMREFRNLANEAPPERIPDELAGQCRVLGLMTQENCGLRSRISRYTYHLLSGIRPASNTGAHLRGERQSFGYSVAVTMWCIQLVEQLSKELAS